MARSPRSTSTRSRAPKPTRASAGKPPRYVDIADRLEEEIRKLGPNSLLATEEQLAERFGVSRITVRGALDLLERSGLVSRLRGRGTVVSPRKIVRRFSPLYSFEKDLADQGIRFVTRLLSYDARVLPPPEIRDRLKLPRDGTVGCLSLLRLVDDRIVCHNFRYYPPRVAEKLQPHQIEVQDASEMLESIVGSTIVGVDWECEIVPVSSEVAAALEVANRTLVLANTYTWRIADGTPVEAGVVSYRIDRCKFKYEITFDHKDGVRGAVSPPEPVFQRAETTRR
ncbi:MAG: GntR family transcriptional regulator [Burkholderiales bacterium]